MSRRLAVLAPLVLAAALVAVPAAAGPSFGTCMGHQLTQEAGGPLEDNIFGTEGDDVLSGGAGNDSIDGAGGNDIICAGSG